MKILFLGDYSNLHACLASELRHRGHQVTVVSDRCGFMNTDADIFLRRAPGFIGGFRYLYDILSILPQLKGYDVVQLINPNFLNLRPGKIKYLFDRIRGQNGAVFLTLAGNDYFFVRACYDAEIFRFSEFKTGNEFTVFARQNPNHMYSWISEYNHRLNSYIYEKVNGAMSVLPEYDMASRPVLGDRLLFTNLPVDLSTLPWSPLPTEGPVRILVGIKNAVRLSKGTDILLAMARSIEKEFPEKVKTILAEDLPLGDYLSEMRESHIVLDQLFSYSPATNAIQAMALGKIAASGAQPEYYDYIGDPEFHPVFSLSPFDTDIRERLIDLIADRRKMCEIGEKGRQIVEKHNDSGIVAEKFIRHWKKLG